jgi:hypothetical protein
MVPAPSPKATTAAAPIATTVLAVLKEIELTQYYEVLMAEGYNEIDDLKNAPLEDLVRDCGLKKPHARRIARYFSELLQVLETPTNMTEAADSMSRDEFVAHLIEQTWVPGTPFQSDCLSQVDVDEFGKVFESPLLINEVKAKYSEEIETFQFNPLEIQQQSLKHAQAVLGEHVEDCNLDSSLEDLKGLAQQNMEVIEKFSKRIKQYTINLISNRSLALERQIDYIEALSQSRQPRLTLMWIDVEASIGRMNTAHLAVLKFLIKAEIEKRKEQGSIQEAHYGALQSQVKALEEKMDTQARVMGGRDLLDLFNKHQAWMAKTKSYFDNNYGRSCSVDDEDYVMQKLFGGGAAASALATLSAILPGGGISLTGMGFVAGSGAYLVLPGIFVVCTFGYLYALSASAAESAKKAKEDIAIEEDNSRILAQSLLNSLQVVCVAVELCAMHTSALRELENDMNALKIPEA